MKHPSGPSGLKNRIVQRNIKVLARYLAGLSFLVVIYSAIFQVIMRVVEGADHSWIAGVYWTIITMTTVGYGDIVFYSDIGRLFSMAVLATGILTFFVVLPYVFIRYFYSPLLETQMRKRTPRSVPADTRGHVIICQYDKLATGIIDLLENEHIPYYVIEPDVEQAAEQYLSGIPVILGDIDDRNTYERLQVTEARMVLANRDDPMNANITLTVREVAADVPVTAIARAASAEDVLTSCGATHVLPLQRWLGEQLANRANASRAQAHVIGRFQDLLIAEFPVHLTPLAGKTIRETHLRNNTGVTIVAVWQHGHLFPARPDMVLSPSSVPVVVGTEAQLDELDFLLAIYDFNPSSVIVVGAGPVGLAAVQSLQRKDVPVRLIERNENLAARVRGVCKEVVEGDAMDPSVLIRSAIQDAPSILLTSSDDAVNIFLAANVRRLNSDVRIVSRITHERNIETIQRAGADLVLGSASLGVQATFSLLQGKELVVLGEGVDLFAIELPRALDGKTLADSDISARTDLTVIAIRHNGTLVTNPAAGTILKRGSELLLFGDPRHRQRFSACFGV